MAEQEFVKVAEVGEVAPVEMTMVRLDRDQILLANVDGTFYAINNMCSHKAGRLAQGRLDDVEGELCVVCPFHSARISLVTGEALTRPAISPSPAIKSVQTYEVRISGDEILFRSANV